MLSWDLINFFLINQTMLDFATIHKIELINKFAREKLILK